MDENPSLKSTLSANPNGFSNFNFHIRVSFQISAFLCPLSVIFEHSLSFVTSKIELIQIHSDNKLFQSNAIKCNRMFLVPSPSPSPPHPLAPSASPLPTMSRPQCKMIALRFFLLSHIFSNPFRLHFSMFKFRF